MTKKYAIVEFEDKQVSTIPSNWLTEDMSCFWPPKKIKKYIKSCENPHTDWVLYKIVKIFGYTSKFFYFYKQNLN